MMVTVKVALPQPDRHQSQIVQILAFKFNVQELTNILCACTYRHIHSAHPHSKTRSQKLDIYQF